MSTAAIAATKKHVLLYFSASWCPPCQRFTPKLIDFCETHSAATNNTDIEIVFISNDRDEASFNAYFGKMPFLALPYAQRDRVASLRERFQVRGIPSLALLDAATGETLNFNIQPLLNRDPRGLFFPYKEVRSLKAVMDQLQLRDGQMDLSEKTIALYLDAPSFKPNMWGKCSGGCGDFAARGVRFSCNTCKYFNVCEICMETIANTHDSTHDFTQHPALDLLGDSLSLRNALLEKYNAAKEQGLAFEAVMVSFAQTEQEHTEHAASVPWPTVAFDERFETAFLLAREFDLEYDETNLVIVDAQRNVINRDAALVVKDADSTFPFSAPTVSDLKDSVYASNLSLQHTPAVVVFTSATQAPEIKKTLTAVAMQLNTTTSVCTDDVCVLPSSSKPDVIFFTETADSNYGGAIKYNAPWNVDAYAPNAPVVVLANFPRREFFVAPPTMGLTQEDVLQFIADFKSGKLKELKDAKEKAAKEEEVKVAEGGKENALKSATPAQFAQKVTTTTTNTTTSTDSKGVLTTVVKTTTSVEIRPVV
ncbi:thioredoxin-like-domain-containing protein [Chytriomyces cf. hyalinus JEL632]|nr:thioredoxin-like-domain-containing protein [Chytriomyces cf. hyalinus JEL632]